jgi:hypothetical protein
VSRFIRTLIFPGEWLCQVPYVVSALLKLSVIEAHILYICIEQYITVVPLKLATKADKSDPPLSATTAAIVADAIILRTRPNVPAWVAEMESGVRRRRRSFTLHNRKLFRLNILTT